MSSNGKCYILLTFIVGIVAVYGQYGGSNDAPAYPPAQAPAIPVFVPYPAPSSPILAELPASHEFLYPRRRHHRRRSSSSSSESRSRSRSSSDSDSNSHSHEHKKQCKNCRKIKKSCKGEKECFTPDIYYFHYKGCTRAVITCDTNSPVKLLTTDGDVLFEGIRAQKVANCGKHEDWNAKDKDGKKVDFKTLRCVPFTVPN